MLALVAARTTSRSTRIRLNVDQLARNAGLIQRVEHFHRQIRRQLHQGMFREDADASEVAGVHTTLVGQGTDDGTRAHALAVAHRQAVHGQLLAVAIRDARSFLIEALVEGLVRSASAAVIVAIAITAARALLLRLLLHQEVLASLQLGSQGCRNVRQLDLVGLRVLLHQVAEDTDLRVR